MLAFSVRSAVKQSRTVLEITIVADISNIQDSKFAVCPVMLKLYKATWLLGRQSMMTGLADLVLKSDLAAQRTCPASDAGTPSCPSCAPHDPRRIRALKPP